ncbi:MAG: DNA polymerase I [Candidatus Omnitrophica bacterium]|nr:DNA polymerase I [Candidatus Omnitrophota bacterium]
MAHASLCLIDANSLFYRAYFAIKAQLVTSSGQPTNAVFGFIKMVNRILEELTPDYLAVCFDVSKVTHRTEKFSDYKVHRAPMPEPLLAQVPAIKEVVRAYNFPLFELEGFEADDVIASIVHKIAPSVEKVVVISSDKDILQLVGGNVEVYNPYKDDGIVFTEEVVKEKLGVSPGKIMELIALMGDASDNIPGAHGIGEKTALELLNDFTDVEDLIKNADRIKGARVKKIVGENIESIRLSRELAKLCTDVPLDVRLEDLKVKPADTDKLWELFSRLEFKGMLKNLSQTRLSSVKNPSLDVEKKVIYDPSGLLKSIEKKGFFAFFVNVDRLTDDVICVNLAVDDGVYETQDKDFLRSLFSKNTVMAVSHDVKSSLHIFSRYSIQANTSFFDTLIAASLVESSRGTRDLESLLWDFLKLHGLSRLDYLGKESHFLLRLKYELEAALEKRELSKLFFDVEMPLVDILFEMEGYGVAVDAGFLKKLSAELDKKLEKIIEKIYALAGCTFNINSPKQLAEVLFNKLKLPVIKKTKTGASTDEEVLTRLSRDNELPKILLEYRQISKLKTTYIDALPQLVDVKSGNIHSTFNQVGAETGRLSSAGPNLQNIPIKTELGASIRRAFVPSKGYDVILSADYSQVELRILAHLSQDPALIEAFNEDRDIHSYTASLIFGVDEKEVSGQMRDNAKRVNFGIIYGMSSYGLAKDLGIAPAAAQAFIDEYFTRYPKVKDFLDSQIAFVKKNGYVMTILGRRRYIPEINNANMAVRAFAERQAINAPIQGSAADLIKLATVDVGRTLRKEDLGARLIMQVHDELVFEARKKGIDQLIARVRGCMEKAISLRVPLKTTISVGKNWLDTQEVS